MTALSYRDAHHNIFLERGKASAHDCYKCGNPAKDWAYQYPEGKSFFTDPEGRRFSYDTADYAPMCFGCHITFDRSKEQRLRDVVADNARRSSAMLAERRKTDEDLDERMKAASRRNLEKGRSPEQARRAGAGGGAALARKWAEDAEFREMMKSVSVENGRKASSMLNGKRVSCGECALESTPGPMTRHFNASGHKRKE